MSDWLNILREEVAKPRTIQAVADQLGYSRVTISRALSEKYDGSTDKIRAKVIATFFDRIVCPHTNADLAQADCEFIRTGPMPQSDAKALDQWTACQFCPNNPNARRTKPRGENVKEYSHA